MGRRKLRSTPWALAAVVVMLGLLATTWAARARHDSGQGLVRTQTENWQDATTDRIKANFEAYATLLDSVAAFWSSSEEVTPAEFARFAGSLHLAERYPGLHRFVFVEPVAWDGRAAFAGRFTADVNPAATPTFSAGDPHELAVATMASTPSALSGVDLAADPARRAALERARDSGRVSMTTPLIRIEDRDLPAAQRPWAVSMYAPVYDGGAPPATVQGRRDAFVGWTAASFLVTDVVDDLGLASSPIRLAISAGRGDDVIELASTAPLAWVQAARLGPPAQLRMFGQLWHVEAAPTDALSTSGRDWVAVLAIGLVGSLALAATMWVLASQRVRLGRQVALAVSDHEQANFRLLRETSFQEALVDHLDVGVLSHAEDGVFRSVNRAATTLLGTTATELRGTTLVEALGRATTPDGEPLVRPGTDPLDLGTRGVELAFDHAGGTRRVALVSSQPVVDRHGRAHGVVTTLYDVTALKVAQARLAELAMRDPLTGLPNRSTFFDRVQQALARSRRNGLGVAVLFVDLDHFKVVNDTRGHHAGDVLLRAVANELSAILREGDVAARYGGDEFVVLCEPVAHEHHAAAIATRIDTAIATACRSLDAARLGVGASIGWAISNGTDDAGSLLQRADEAMYALKRGEVPPARR